MLLQLSHFPPFTPLRPAHPLPPAVPLFSSCPWVEHVSSLVSPFLILFLTTPSIFYLPFMLIPCIFSPLSSTHSPTDNPVRSPFL